MSRFRLAPTAPLQAVRQQARRQGVRSLVVRIAPSVCLVLCAGAGQSLSPWAQRTIPFSHLSGSYNPANQQVDAKQTASVERMQRILDACTHTLRDRIQSAKDSNNREDQDCAAYGQVKGISPFLATPNRLVDSAGRGWGFDQGSQQWLLQTP